MFRWRPQYRQNSLNFTSKKVTARLSLQSAVRALGLIPGTVIALSLSVTNAVHISAIAADVNVSGLTHASTSVSAVEQSSGVDSKKRLLQQEKQKLEREKHEYHTKAAQLRKKEDQAFKVLHVIQQQLNQTNGQLTDTKHQVDHTTHKIEETAATLNTVQTKELSLKECAAKRLREIYEGNRLSFVEMLFQVDNLQSLLDRMYYQERVAEQDKKLIDELREREALLAHNKEELGQKKNVLADLVSQIAQKAMEIAKAKSSQQETADKLRSQRAFYEQAEHELAQESHRLENQIFIMESANHKRGGPITVGSGTMCIPLRAPVTSPFGWRNHPIFGVRKFHTGVDLAGPNHSAIRAADGGNVLFTGWYGGYGKVVIVSHGNGMATLYAHLSRTAVNVGDNVNKGDIIAYEGTTGFSTGPHLHFEVRVNGKPNNPLNYVR
jgi:murein DD-endopeptidase MepM/ murein hydrolase activator NlpD